ncbi:transcriptional repressor LexA [Ruminococcus sp. Marseille-P6503]|uniref:transcriptional repressor LexA n=1 Tax=Ruminococcus sp. Marseille-P6503 TaxID=2364796 RepID=UPI000F547F51|nr:transcriptional repressor LexA [Ruminococcus sp. Marseille-P6503]
MKLTENERKVFEFVKQRLEEGYPPTVREICAQFGFKSTSTAHRYIASLTEKGFLEKGANQNRALKLVGRQGTMVPLVGTVTAGMPITAVEDVTDYISFQPAKRYANPLFALKVRGDSMINAAILDGDIVIAEQASVVDNGDIAVCLVDGESATVKRFYKENGHYRLQPENDAMEPIIADEVSILGRVVAVIRYI